VTTIATVVVIPTLSTVVTDCSDYCNCTLYTMLVWGLDDDLDQSLAATSPLLAFLSLPSLRAMLALLCSVHDGLT
jgi:hypothetical protein